MPALILVSSEAVISLLQLSDSEEPISRDLLISAVQFWPPEHARSQRPTGVSMYSTSRDFQSS